MKFVLIDLTVVITHFDMLKPLNFAPIIRLLVLIFRLIRKRNIRNNDTADDYHEDVIELVPNYNLIFILLRIIGLVKRYLHRFRCTKRRRLMNPHKLITLLHGYRSFYCNLLFYPVHFQMFGWRIYGML